jgi:nucleotide-binding universal stress UspA family protein
MTQPRIGVADLFSSKTYKNLQETLTKAVAETKHLRPNLKVAADLKEGKPAAQIVKAAEVSGFNFIVAGHRGSGRLSEVLLGGVSEPVSHMAKCAVVIAKQM